MPVALDITQKSGFLDTTLHQLDMFMLSGAMVHTQLGPLQKVMLCYNYSICAGDVKVISGTQD
jgi:hypothetical protein